MAFSSIQGFFRSLAVVAGALLACAPAHASLTVLVGEPYGSFGTMMPQGHTAVYLDHLCADGPLKIRECRPGEPEGVVIARYFRVGKVDWIATPVLEYLYASETPRQVPEYVTPEVAWDLRQRFRTRSMQEVVPDGTERDKRTEDWWETVGSAFDRRLWGYQVDTTAEQDRAFMETINADPNRRVYHLRNANCANFVADVVNLYFPGTVVRPDDVADMGLMTPKHVARCFYTMGERDPELHLRVLEIPQVAGTLRRSRPVRGAWESVLTTKRYLFTLVAIQPEIPVVAGVLYAIHGRWSMDQDAVVVGPATFGRTLPGQMGELSDALTAEAEPGATSDFEKHPFLQATASDSKQ